MSLVPCLLLNEFRKDLVSGEWVLFATGRARRPGGEKNERQILKVPKENCPFEDPEKSGNEILATYPDGQKNDWFAKVTKNKFPAVIEGESGPKRTAGPFQVTDARGLHEVIIYRDHDRNLDQYSPEEFSRILSIYQERYKAMALYSSSRYILIFHNHGPAAGASIAHPHSQIISIPIMPPDVKRSIQGSKDFYEENGKRVYDIMLDWEIVEKKRIIYENKHFVAFCPFISKTPYEVRIFPRESHAHFESMPAELLLELGDTMLAVLKKINKALNAPDFNYFVHTAPADNKNSNIHDFYAWHIEVIPKMKIEGAFELGSGVEVNIIDPDQAAEELRTI